MGVVISFILFSCYRVCKRVKEWLLNFDFVSDLDFVKKCEK